MLGEYLGSETTIDGQTCLLIKLDNPKKADDLKDLIGSRISLNVEKYSPKRSLNANGFFWKLIGQISKKLGSPADVVYQMELKNYGVFDYYELPLEASEKIRKLYRFSEEDDRWTEWRIKGDGEEALLDMCQIRCWKGSHEYTRAEFSDLLQGTINDAHDLGIKTDIEAIDNLIARWERNEDKRSIEDNRADFDGE